MSLGACVISRVPGIESMCHWYLYREYVSFISVREYNVIGIGVESMCHVSLVSV